MAIFKIPIAEHEELSLRINSSFDQGLSILGVVKIKWPPSLTSSLRPLKKDQGFSRCSIVSWDTNISYMLRCDCTKLLHAPRSFGLAAWKGIIELYMKLSASKSIASILKSWSKSLFGNAPSPEDTSSISIESLSRHSFI